MRNPCWLLSVMLIAACFSDPIQNDDTGESNNDGSTGDGDGDGDPGDGDGDGEGQCVPDPPTGWQGPVALNIGSAPEGLACESAWPVEQANGGVGDPAGAPTCNACSCGDPSGGSCPTSAPLFRHVAGDATCMTMPLDSVESTVECQEFGIDKAGMFHGGPPMMPTPGSCETLGGEVVDPEPAFAQFGKVCSFDGAASACDGGVTVPDFEQPADWATCIWQDGELPSCPPGSDYAEGPFVIADMFADTRDCSDCGCSPAAVECSPYTSSIYPGPGCSLGSVTIAHDDTCLPNQIGSWRLKEAPMLLSQSNCTASGGVSSGAVTVEHQMTLCCL